MAINKSTINVFVERNVELTLDRSSSVTSKLPTLPISCKVRFNH